MTRQLWLVGTLALAACTGSDVREREAEPEIRNDAATYGPWDARLPLFDAATPEVSCRDKHGNPHVDAGSACPLPPSTCADDIWLVYYTEGTCVDGRCEFKAELMYCYTRCVQLADGSGGCDFGFT